jgi:hypothetical protein
MADKDELLVTGNSGFIARVHQIRRNRTTRSTSILKATKASPGRCPRSCLSIIAGALAVPLSLPRGRLNGRTLYELEPIPRLGAMR